MKRVLTLLVVALFIIVPSAVPTYQANLTLKPMFSTLEDVTLQDDAFQGQGKRPYAEWWYFDAVFDNGYTMTLAVKVFNIRGCGGVSTRVDVYQEESLVFEHEQTHSLKEFSFSMDVPMVAIRGEELIQGSYDPLLHQFEYNLSYQASSFSCSLRFLGCTQGWKRQQKAGDWWAVMLPRATVTGTLTINGTAIKVAGTGYHDHIWGVHPRVALNYGWFWGTYASTNYSVTWAMTYPMRLSRHPMMVVNEKNGGYLDIPPETIRFSAEQLRFDHLRLIPMYLDTETMTETLFLTVTMQVVGVDHTRLLGVIEYWRYHMKCSGSIMMEGHMETVEGVFIAEYLRFR